MLDQILTLPRNEGATAEPDYDWTQNWANIEYRNQTRELNRALYVSANHTGTSRDTMTVLRTFPKRSDKSFGTQKATVKFTVDVQVTNPDNSQSIAPVIVELNVSIPAGAGATGQYYAMRRLSILAAAVRNEFISPETVGSGMLSRIIRDSEI